MVGVPRSRWGGRGGGRSAQESDLAILGDRTEPALCNGPGGDGGEEAASFVLLRFCLWPCYFRGNRPSQPIAGGLFFFLLLSGIINMTV